MRFLKQITVTFLAMIYLVISAGFLIYKTECICKGDEEVSFYKAKKICGDNICLAEPAINFPEKIAGEKGTCCSDASDKKDCGCPSPEVTYIRLINQFTKEEIEFLKTEINDLLPLTYALIEDVLKKIDLEMKEFYIDPPPHFASSTEFLIKINKLKIPEIA